MKQSIFVVMHIGLLSVLGNQTLVAAIIAIANTFNRIVIVEGLETLAQIDKLLELACKIGQGFALAKPMNKKYFVNRIQQQYG